MMNFNFELDASHLKCPLPVLKTKKKLQQMQSGEILKVFSTDIISKDDFKTFADISGNKLLHVEDHGNSWVFYLQKL